MENIMIEAILTLGVFAVPILAVAIIEAERIKRIRETEQFKHGMAYRDECFKQSVLNTERQQVDKEEKRFAN